MARYFTPGPSQLYPTVSAHIARALESGIASISHRSKEFRDVFASTQQHVRDVMSIPSDWHVFFLSSGTECMERIVQNCVEKESFHLVNGAFSRRWYTIAGKEGKRTVKEECEAGKPFDFSHLHIPQSAELITITQTETSTGVSIPLDAIKRIRHEHPNQLIAVDMVSSAPYFSIDPSCMDIAFFAVQKGFGMPAGLGVLAVSCKAIEKSKFLSQKTGRIGSYHTFPALLDDELKSQTPETPNVLGIWLLGEVCKDMKAYGIERIRKETEEKASLLYHFFDEHAIYNPFVRQHDARSQTVIVIDTPQGSTPLLSHLKGKGIIAGGGYAQFRERHLRIANFPAHTLEDIRQVLTSLEEFR